MDTSRWTQTEAELDADRARFTSLRLTAGVSEKTRQRATRQADALDADLKKREARQAKRLTGKAAQERARRELGAAAWKRKR